MKTIPLTRGRVTIVDDEDYEFLSQWKWYFQPRSQRTPEIGYAARKVWTKEKQTLVLMHRLIMDVHGKGREVQVDHKSGDMLDNRRENLRVCTRSENAANSRKRPARGRGHTSRYKGVTYDLKNEEQPWKAQLGFRRRKIQGGSHATEEEAARAYDRLAVAHFGEFAKTNFPAVDYRSLSLCDGLFCACKMWDAKAAGSRDNGGE